MFKNYTRKRSRRVLIPAAVFVLLLALAPVAAAQETTPAPQTPARTPPTRPATTPPAAETTNKTEAQLAAGLTREPTTAPKAAEPLYREYRGVTLGMSAGDVRAKWGKPEEKSDEMDLFVFSERERARVYYTGGKASAVIATYIGRDAAAPAPAAVLGADVEAKPDGSMYQMTHYPQAGYWVAYSRTPGDSPMVLITMQKLP